MRLRSAISLQLSLLVLVFVDESGVTRPMTRRYEPAQGGVDHHCELIKDRRGLCMDASATTKINHMDFGMISMPGIVGTDVAITIDVELVKSSAPTPPPVNHEASTTCMLPEAQRRKPEKLSDSE